MKFGGISSPFGIIFYSDNFYCKVFEKVKLTWHGFVSHGVKVEVKPAKGFFGKQINLFVLFVLMDLFYIFRIPITNFINQKSTDVGINIVMPTMQTNPIITSIIAIIVVLLNISTWILLIWYLRKTRGYHGAEHKTIASVEHKNDLKNVLSYSRIHERCGTNLMPLYLVFVALTGFYFMPLPGTSILVSMMCYKKVPILKKVSVKLGSYLQVLTTREPNQKELRNSTIGMEALLQAERAFAGKSAYINYHLPSRLR